MKVLKYIRLISLISNLQKSIKMKDWKTTLTGIATLVATGIATFDIEIPFSITEIITAVAGALLLIVSDPKKTEK